MADISTTLPPVDEAKAFKNLVNSARIKKNALLPGFMLDYDDGIREEVLNHAFFEAISRHPKFKKVIRYLRSKKSEGDFPPRLEIEIACCIADVLPIFDHYKLNPKKMKRTTVEAADKASQHVNALIDMLISDLYMESFDDYAELRRLLEKLNRELSGEDKTTY